jgi:hypothetical protein
MAIILNDESRSPKGPAWRLCLAKRGDITSGRIWQAEMKKMLAGDDGDPKTMSEFSRSRYG